jgi:hypothetical protein
MDNIKDISHMKDLALAVITKYFGEHNADLYREFYADKDIDTVKASVKELLSEYLGAKKAEEQMKQFQQNIS